MTLFSADWLKTLSVCVCVWGGCLGGLFIYLLCKIPETVSKTKDMSLSVLHRGMGCEPNTCSRHERVVWKEPGPPETRDSLVLTSILEVNKVKGVLCEKAELNWLQVIYNQRWLSFCCLLQVSNKKKHSGNNFCGLVSLVLMLLRWIPFGKCDPTFLN